nr:integrase, catalytic region, zinc finger, CCHC-type, peptidase aspartic, catalytic [Tanacetum cinerariifolium]
MQTQTSNTLHNAIIKVGGKDRPPMLAPGNYVQWKSRIKRYIDTKSNHELIHYCLQNLPYKYKWADKDVPVAEGIDNDTYSTVDACPNACEMWKAIESECLVITSTTTRIAKHQNEVNEIRAERLARTANPHALVAQQQLVYHPQNHPTHYTQNSSTRSQQAATRNRGKTIVNSLPPIYDQEPSMVAEDDEMSKDNEIDKIQADWKDDTDDKPEYQELEAHYMYMAQIREVTPDAADNSRPIFDTEPLQKAPNNDNYNVFAIESEHPEQSKYINDTYSIKQDEHNVIIDSLDMSEIEDFKTKNKSLESSKNHFKEANNELSKTNQLMYNDIKKFQAELDRYNDVKQTIAKRTYFGHIDSFIQNTIEGNFCPEIRRINADLQKFHLCLKEEMVADLRYFNSLKLEVDSLKSQLETQKTHFLNKIDQLSRKYYYADHMNAILGVYTELDNVTNLQCDYLETLEKCECLEKELSKSKVMSKSFESKEFRKEREQYFEIQDLKAQLQDKRIAINELKKLIEKLKGKSVETKFEKSLVIQQSNAFKSQRPSILGKSTIFSDSLEKKDCSKSKSVTKNNVSNDFSKSVTAQILPPNKKSILKNTNVLASGMYKLHTEPIQTRTTQLPHVIRKTNKRVSFSTGVISPTSVSRPQLKSNQMEDRVMLNNSQGKKQEVEDHRRNVKFSKNKTYVTACNDSLNAKTSNVNFICVTCGKCMLKDKHDICVLYSLNGVNSRTKMPMVVPISTREPKRTVNQSVAKPLKRTLVEIILFIVDSRCSKHMTRNLKLLINFVKKFLGTVKFGNDQIAPILGYGDLVQGIVTIERVYYVEGLNHNLFSVGQLCDADLEVAFRKSTCYIRDLKGNDLLTGSRGTDLYSITLQDTSSPNLICLMAKATSDGENLDKMKEKGKRKTRKEQNRIKTGQKQEAWRSPENLNPITVKKERKMKKIQVQGTKRYKS